tara:strand:- start:76 stop:369 length:294 start_codon:yes stop_codon:yes gene_type:complete
MEKKERLSTYESKLNEVNNYNKELYDFKDACSYLGISTSTLYKLTMNRTIRHSKPNGKKIYFLKEDLKKWATSNPIKTQEELDQISMNHLKDINYEV